MTMDQIGMVHPFGELMEYITSVESYLSMMFLAMRIALNKQQKYVWKYRSNSDVAYKDQPKLHRDHRWNNSTEPSYVWMSVQDEESQILKCALSS